MLVMAEWYQNAAKKGGEGREDLFLEKGGRFIIG
jgi:hypothetical protein